MDYRTELCRFSGAKIYPGKGIRFVRSDSQVIFGSLWVSFCLLTWMYLLHHYATLIFQVFLFANSKCKRYFHNRLKPAKLTWTAMYRKQHKKVYYYKLIFSYLGKWGQELFSLDKVCYIHIMSLVYWGSMHASWSIQIEELGQERFSLIATWQ